MSATVQLYSGLADLQRVSQACVVLTTVFLGLRLWTRARILRAFSLDDWFIIPCWLAGLGAMITALFLITIVDGLFKGKQIDLNDINLLVKMASSFYALAMAFLKLSLGSFFLRLFSVFPVQRGIIITVVIVSTILSLISFLMSATTCGASGGFFGTDKTCNIARQYSIITTVWSYFNAIGDFIFAALAVDAIRVAQMDFRTKILASMILVLGTMGGIVSVIRVYIITHSVGQRGSTQGIIAGKLTVLEISIGLTAANMACLRPLLRKLRETIVTQWTTGQSPANTDATHPQSPINSKGPSMNASFFKFTSKKRTQTECQDAEDELESCEVPHQGSSQSDVPGSEKAQAEPTITPLAEEEVEKEERKDGGYRISKRFSFARFSMGKF